MKAIGDAVQRYPLLRLLVSFVCGIGLADVLYPHIPSLCIYGACSAVALLLALLFLFRSRSYGIVVAVLFMALGLWEYAQARDNTLYAWPSESVLYEARVLSLPHARQRSMRCEVEVVGVCDSSVWMPVERKVFVYMEPCDEADGLLPGDVFCFKGVVQAPRNFSDSLSFDYARYVALQGASGTIFLPRKSWRRIGEEEPMLNERMLRLRRQLSQRYMETTFDGDALGVLLALTLGDKRGLSAEVRTAYSDAGAAHVLALSGMHVAIICGVLSFLLRGLLRQRRLRWLCESLTIVLLWAFALLVGMSASVVRAVAMCTLYIVARWFSDGTTSSFHVLSLTAFLMLLVRPLYLFDVGFQLSFMAMASILWFEPYLEGLVHKHTLHPVVGYLVGIVCMSLAAQLGTFPLVLYYFGTFPTYFLLTNMLVVPILFVVLLFMMLWWALSLAGIPFAQSLGVLLQRIVEWLTHSLHCIGQWPGAVLNVENYNGLSVLFSYLLILFVGLFFTERWSRAIVFALASLLGLLLSLLF